MKKQRQSLLAKKWLRIGGMVVLGMFVCAGVAYWIVQWQLGLDTNYRHGVLVINTDRPYYTVGEKVLLQAAATESSGKHLCQAPLTVVISVPGQWEKELLSMKDDHLTPTASCATAGANSNEADYIARFEPKKPGRYKVVLKNDVTGKYVKTTFLVGEKTESIIVERLGAMRVSTDQTARFPMVIKLTAQRDFTGILTETVPSEFRLVWTGPAKVKMGKQANQLSWDVVLKAGESKQFAYEYAPPAQSPFFTRKQELQLIDQNGTPVDSGQPAWQILTAKQ